MPVIDFCKIQEGQLAAARDKLLQSVSSIIDNLNDISRNIIEISQDAQELSRAHTEGDHSVLEEVEGHLQEAASGLSQYCSASHDLTSLMGSVAPAIGDMASCLRDIEGIEIAIERIALNACIKAAHLGKEGATLGVLAEGIQRLVGDTRQQTVNVSQKLESIIATAQELNVSDGNNKDESEMEMSSLIIDIGSILQSLRTSEEQSRLDLTEVQEKGSILSDDLQKVCEGIKVHEQAAKTIDHILAELQDLGKRLELQSELIGLDKIGHLEVEKLSDNYTMKDERLVHLSIATPLSTLESESVLLEIQANHSSINEDKSESEEDLGDNVELF
jgi:methyl-accepting chemotaxis protein